MKSNQTYDISFIIPAHNEAAKLETTVNSVLAQRNIHPQLIIIDGSSQPPLKDLFTHKSWNKQIFRLKTDRGASFARNQGLLKVKAPFVCFLDADDILEPSFGEQMIAFIKKSNSAALCLSKTLFDDDLQFINKFVFSLINYSRNLILRTLFLINKQKLPLSAFFAVSTSRLVFPTKLAQELKFNESANQCEDWELGIRTIKKAGIKIVPEKLLLFRFSSSSQTRKTRKKYGLKKYYQICKLIGKEKQNHPLIIGFKLYTKVLEKYYEIHP